MARPGRAQPLKPTFLHGTVQPLGPYPTLAKVISLAENPRDQKRLPGRVIRPIRGVVQPLGPYPTRPRVIDAAVDPRAARSDRERKPAVRLLRPVIVPPATPRLVEPLIVLQPTQPRDQKRQPGGVRWVRGVVQPLGPYPTKPYIVRAAPKPRSQTRNLLPQRPPVPPPVVSATPLRTTFIVAAAASQTGRRARVRFTAAQPEAVPMVPLRTVTIKLAAQPRRRPGRLVTGEAPPLQAAPQSRNVFIRAARAVRRRLFGRVLSDRQRMAVPSGVTPTLITTPATGYVSVDSHGDVGVGDTAQPNVGSTGIVGQTGGSGSVNV